MPTIQFRRKTAAEWTSSNPVLAAGEFGYETDTGRYKIGNGVHNWASRIYYYNYREIDPVGNLLTDNVASGTDTLGTTEGFTSDGGATLSSTTGDPLTGARSLRAQATVATNASYVSCPSDQSIPVVPGQTMTLRAMIKTPSHTGEEWVARLEFVGVLTLLGTQVLVNNIGYTEVAWTGVVPAGATTVRWHFRRMVGVNGAVAYLDELSLHAGAGGSWAMPGAFIAGLNQRTNENGDIELWDYDSGAWVGPYVEKATVGNLLTDNQASIETDLTGWETYYNGSVSRSTVTSYFGSASLLVTATANGSFACKSSDGILAVVPNRAYSVSARVKTNTPRNTYVSIWWYTSGWAFISGTSGTASVPTADVWKEYVATGVAPANAAYANVLVIATDGLTGESFYADAIGLWEGAGGNWTMPGTPIIGLGKRTNENGDIELWDDESAAWVGPYAEKVTVGNLLADNPASGTDTLGDVSDIGLGGSGTRESSTEKAYSGTRSIKATYSGVAGWMEPNFVGLTFLPNTTYTFTFKVYTDLSGRSVRGFIRWYYPTLLRTDTVMVSLLPGTWTTVTLTVLSPNTTTPISVAPSIVFQEDVTGLQVGDIYYIDNIGFWAGAGGNWAMPGTPITGLGTRITRPNVDDRLVEQWNGTEWSVVDYDSGERNVAGMVLNGWTVVRSKLMRTGNVVTLTVVNASPTSATSDIFMSLPSGFRPLDDGGMLTQEAGWADSPTIVNSRLAVNGNVEIRRTGYSGSVQFKWTWVTKDSQPNTLPGTLDTPAPE